MSVTRYDMRPDRDPPFHAYMHRTDSGEYVKYEDYTELVAAISIINEYSKMTTDILTAIKKHIDGEAMKNMSINEFKARANNLSSYKFDVSEVDELCVEWLKSKYKNCGDTGEVAMELLDLCERITF